MELAKIVAICETEKKNFCAPAGDWHTFRQYLNVLELPDSILQIQRFRFILSFANKTRTLHALTSTHTIDRKYFRENLEKKSIQNSNSNDEVDRNPFSEFISYRFCVDEWQTQFPTAHNME